MSIFHANILLLCFTENLLDPAMKTYLHANLASLLDLCLYFFLVLPLPFVNNLPLDVKCLELRGKIMHFQSVS